MFDASRINETAFTYYLRLGKVREYVQANHSEDVSLTVAAGIAGLEKKYFSSFFRRKVGVCFKDYVAHVRVTKAVELMRTRNYSITDVALSVGFRDLRTFERTFKKHKDRTAQAFKSSARPA